MIRPMTDEERQRAKERAMANKELAMIVVTDVTEHENGSATYTFDMDDASAKKIAELGIELILTCAAYGLDVQDALEDIRWAGEQKELAKKLSNYGKEKDNGTDNT